MPPVHAPPLLEQVAPSAAPARGTIAVPAFVDAQWLLDNLDAVRVVDTRPRADHSAAHVPGACSFPLDALLVDDSSRPAVARLAGAAQAALARCGISPTDHVVLVDGADGSAALGAVICELAGMERVTVVHGSGTEAWRALGGIAATTPRPCPASTDDAWLATSPRLQVVAAFEDTIDAVLEGTGTIVDARSQLEHEGIVGSPCCSDRGAIPGSVHLEWTAFFDISGAPHGEARIREIAGHVGLEPGDPVIVACHAGHRAAIAGRVLRAAGFRDVRVSLGSWHEWSARGLGDGPVAN